ncbi:MAG: ChaN family lipoprotein [Gemmatimonadota bacterium]|jgi:uncharacterized iron-regulated protein|nr:ChaN family lipoprotein [Gemmatimonadota bacterium]
MAGGKRPLIPRQLGQLLGLGCLIMMTACASGGGGGTISRTPPAVYRVYDVAAGRFISVAQLSENVRGADVVLFGEIHDDLVAHRIQLELLQRLANDNRERALGMEMFERDVQGVVDGYTLRRISEEEFLAASRPWSNYATGYRPLVDAARSGRWSIEATNTPQTIASSIARYGLPALGSLSLDERRQVAADLQCPRDDYWSRFQEAMHGASDSPDAVALTPADTMFLARAYEAQCARDETMAEAIVALVPAVQVLHINGSFHSDFGLGIVPRIHRRAPGTTVVTISAFPVDDLADPPLDEDLDRADFIIFTTEDILGALGS